MISFSKNSGLRRKVLVVDDEMVNCRILGNILEDYYDISYAENGKQAYEMLSERNSNYSLVLLDLLMPEMTGLELLDILKAEDYIKKVPIIVMTSEKDAEVESIKKGAADFITKPYDMPEVILARCERIIELYEGKSIIKSAEMDDLTGLYSKEFFFEYIRQYEKYNAGCEMDAIALNIEHFRMINEMYGRRLGDDVLRKTGIMLRDLFAEDVFIGCRLEADTFYIYVPHKEEYEDVFIELQNELIRVTQLPRIRFRIGIYQSADSSIPADTRFDHAKQACDRIRGDYTRQISYYREEHGENDLYQERLINDIDSAIENRDFTVFYQPKYDIRGEKPVLRSAEALIRWKHPELGMISPGHFIPLFESNGLIQKVDNYVWEEAARQIKAWRDEFGVTIPVSVNMSRIDVYDPELEKKLDSILERNEITSRDLMLEITESAYSESVGELIAVIERLRNKGFKIEMDDFGSGYSSLNMITTIPIDVLKMDMKFIQNMQKDEKSLKLVELVIDIAKFLDVPVVAEGVEDETEMNLLKNMGCDIIQGYYFSKPVPAEEFSAFIR